ncbi:MAG: hypothetical protein H6R07_255 [Proteobacteria bacterium]|nr:hypothetical protein [Pseudomonadota bacterium]
MNPRSGPAPAHLQAFRDWHLRQSLPDNALRAMVEETLANAGCRLPRDSACYCQYLGQLAAGRHDMTVLQDLSFPARQQAGAVLVAWRQWLVSRTHTPSCLEPLLLDCLAAMQPLLHPQASGGRHDRDPVTGLLDRAALPAALAQAQSQTGENRIVALLYTEITHGQHVYSDALLQVLAQRLAALLRNQDTLLLLDRQSFGLVLANLNGEGHALLAANRVMQCFNDAILMQDGNAVRLHPRIGIALSPQHGETAKQLLEASTNAARSNPADGIGIYDAEQDRLNFSLHRLEAPLRNALEHNLFNLVFQPQVYCRRYGLYGMESLLRWQDEKLGQVRVDEIIMVAEHLGLMGSLTHWILNASLREYAKLLKAGIPGSISINLAPSNLLDRELPARIQDALTLWQVPAHRVILEITESALIGNLGDALRSLRALKGLGCKLALDDFGTGYSSLSYLKQLPIDELKIDRSFIVSMRESQKDAGIVRTIIELSHLLGLTVVTEGVEDAETTRLLAEMGNDVIQGYFFSKPLAPDEIPPFYATLKQRERNTT